MPADDIRIPLDLKHPDDIVRARQAGRDAARTLGFGIADQTRLATAISEIARNALHYGGGGTCRIVGLDDGYLREIAVTITDLGPGIPDIGKAMTPGFSTGNSLGMGLPGARRLVDLLDIDSRPGQTSVRLVMGRRGSKAPEPANLGATELAISAEHDVGRARRLATDLAGRLGISRTNVYRLATSVTELANNLVVHATNGGIVRLIPVRGGGELWGIEVVVEDHGPGIADTTLAMTDGFSTKHSLGGGLSGSRRLMDEFNIEFGSGRGHPGGGAAMAMTVGIARASANAADICGDMAQSWSQGGRDLVAVADGLGHGAEAADAAAAAMAHLGGHLGDELIPLFRGMDSALGCTRGAAVGVAAIDAASGTLTYAALGNTRAAIFGWRTTRLDSHAGIVGAGFRRLVPMTVPIRPGDCLILWTDGIDDQLSLAQGRDCALPVDDLAALLLRRHLKGGDDACVVIARISAP